MVPGGAWSHAGACSRGGGGAWSLGWCMVLGGCMVPGRGLVSHHAPRQTAPVNRMTDRCKNFTLPQTSFAGGKKMTALLTSYCFVLYKSHLHGTSTEKPMFDFALFLFLTGVSLSERCL